MGNNTRLLGRGNIIFFLLIVLSVLTVSPFMKIHLGNTTLTWIFQFLLLAGIFIVGRREGIFRLSYLKQPGYIYIGLYFLWLAISVVRGCTRVGSYWEWKTLIGNTMNCTLPLLALYFYDPDRCSSFFRYWNKWGLIAFFLFIVWNLGFSSYSWYASPFLVYLCMYQYLDEYWRIWTAAFMVLFLLGGIATRTQILRVAISLMVYLGYRFSQLTTSRVLRLVRTVCIFIPIVLLILGITGQFNIFEDMGSLTDVFFSDADTKEEFAADSRTVVYEEIISSSVKKDEIFIGDTPAGGYISDWFQLSTEYEMGGMVDVIGRGERSSSEVVLLNIYLYMGLIGLFFYSMVYLSASYLAISRSQNIGIKLLGVFIVLRWVLGWIEDFNNYNMSNVCLWIIIGMALSPYFRKMTDLEFKNWFTSIFHNN